MLFENITAEEFAEIRAEEKAEEEREKGREEHEKTLTLMQKLLADGRIDDAKKATEDDAFRKALMKEYGL